MSSSAAMLEQLKPLELLEHLAPRFLSRSAGEAPLCPLRPNHHRKVSALPPREAPPFLF